MPVTRYAAARAALLLVGSGPGPAIPPRAASRSGRPALGLVTSASGYNKPERPASHWQTGHDDTSDP